MRSAKRFGLFLAWLIGLFFTFVGVCKNDPFLVSLRGTGNIIIVASCLVVVASLTKWGYWKRAGIAGRWLLLLWLLPPLSILSAKASFESTRQGVLQTESSLAQRLGRHFIVGYSSFGEVARLAEKGLITGVYVSHSNVARRKPQVIKAEIAALQDRRRRAGLPPLIVAADQEGGIVSHLSPPLTRLPSLSTLAELSPDKRAKKAEEFGKTHGRELASLGITLDFAPVLDLKPKGRRNRFDLNTMTGERAISENPAIVSEVALAYVRGLGGGRRRRDRQAFSGARARARRHPHRLCRSRYAHRGAGGFRLVAVQGRSGRNQRGADGRPCQPDRSRCRTRGVAFQGRH